MPHGWAVSAGGWFASSPRQSFPLRAISVALRQVPETQRRPVNWSSIVGEIDDELTTRRRDRCECEQVGVVTWVVTYT